MKEVINRIKKIGVITLSSLELFLLTTGCGVNTKKVEPSVGVVPIASSFTNSSISQLTKSSLEFKSYGGSVKIPLNNSFSLFISQNYSSNREKFLNLSLGVNYSFSIFKNFSLNLNAGYGIYSSDNSRGNFSLEGELNYKGKINADVCITYLLKNEDFSRGARLSSKIYKKIPIISKKDFNFYLTPSLSALRLYNWYGNSGFAHITPGISFGIQKGKINADFFSNRKFAIMNGMTDVTYNGININYLF